MDNVCLEFNITVWKNDDTFFHYDDPVQLLNNGFVFVSGRHVCAPP